LKLGLKFIPRLSFQARPIPREYEFAKPIDKSFSHFRGIKLLPKSAKGNSFKHRSVIVIRLHRRYRNRMKFLLSLGYLVLVSSNVTLPICGAETRTPFSGGRWIDLTHDFSTNTIYWPTASGFELEVEFHGLTPKGYFYAANRYRASEHGGTHIDAPIHFARDHQTVDQLSIEQLTGVAVVVDVSAAALKNSDYQIAVADLKAWETKHRRIPNGAMLLLHTGYGRLWPDAKKYLGTDEKGPEAVEKLHFPGLHPDTARWLVAERTIKAVGLDTASIDYGQSKLFETHRVLFEKNIPAFENVAALDQLPPTGAYVIALPMKIKGGSGGPLRIVAWAPGK
jgi:kynurenine formamidase